MVRGLGVEHKSLIVPGVAEGAYAIRFEHADYLTKDFNISVGSGLPSTFTEAMVEEVRHLSLVLPNANGKLFLSNTITACDDHTRACTEFRFQLMNDGNITITQPWYEVWIVGDMEPTYFGTAPAISPGDTTTVIADLICALPGGLPIGTHAIKVEIGVGRHPETPTDTATDTLFVIEWATDITFIATAPGIDDLHGVEVFIDGTSMGTT